MDGRVSREALVQCARRADPGSGAALRTARAASRWVRCRSRRGAIRPVRVRPPRRPIGDQPSRRTVCGMLTGAGLDQVWHHSRAHRFFTNARWSGDALGLVLADLIVARLLPAGAAITIAVDDTLFKRSGKKVFGVAWHHDGAAKGPKPIGFGNCWVVAGIVVQLSFLSRPVCLPVLARLWRPRQTGCIA